MISLLLTSCTGFQLSRTKTHPNGVVDELIVQVDAVLAKGDGSARKVKKGENEISSVQANYDGTGVATAISGDRVIIKGTETIQNSRNIETVTQGRSTDLKTKTQGAIDLKGTRDPNIIPADPNR